MNIRLDDKRALVGGRSSGVGAAVADALADASAKVALNCASHPGLADATVQTIKQKVATIIWSADGWVGTNQAETTEIGALKLRFDDVPRKDCADGAVIGFTFFWKEAQHWEDGNYPVAVDGPTHNDNDVAKHGASTR
jgi:NAD(P)-dependent dehydrogenase (short-subunit alcohol dehydrogenase family)